MEKSEMSFIKFNYILFDTIIILTLLKYKYKCIVILSDFLQAKFYHYLKS